MTVTANAPLSVLSLAILLQGLVGGFVCGVMCIAIPVQSLLSIKIKPTNSETTCKFTIFLCRIAKRIAVTSCSVLSTESEPSTVVATLTLVIL